VADFSVSPSALAYLFGDTLQNLFAGKSRLPINETLPCREVKLRRKDLAVAVLVTAFADLVRKGNLKLNVQTKGRIIKSKSVLATAAGTPVGSLAGLEAQLLGNLRRNQNDDDVPSVVARLWSHKVDDPFNEVMDMARTYLEGQGYFVEEKRQGLSKLLGKKLVPQCDKILALQGQAGPLYDMVAAFRSTQPEVYAQLWNDISKGIASQQEKVEADFD
jgi:hypothetical protein